MCPHTKYSLHRHKVNIVNTCTEWGWGCSCSCSCRYKYPGSSVCIRSTCSQRIPLAASIPADAHMATPALTALPNKPALWRIEKLPIAEIKHRLGIAELPDTGNKRTLARRLHEYLAAPPSDSERSDPAADEDLSQRSESTSGSSPVSDDCQDARGRSHSRRGHERRRRHSRTAGRRHARESGGSRRHRSRGRSASSLSSESRSNSTDSSHSSSSSATSGSSRSALSPSHSLRRDQGHDRTRRRRSRTRESEPRSRSRSHGLRAIATAAGGMAPGGVAVAQGTAAGGPTRPLATYHLSQRS